MMEREHDKVVEDLFRTRMPRYCDELPPNPSTLISKALCEEPLTTHHLPRRSFVAMVQRYSRVLRHRGDRGGCARACRCHSSVLVLESYPRV